MATLVVACLLALSLSYCLAMPPRSADEIWQFVEQRDAHHRLEHRPKPPPIFAIILGTKSNSPDVGQLPLFRWCLPSLVKFAEHGVVYRLYVVYDEDDDVLSQNADQLAALIEESFTAPLAARQFDVSAVAIAAPNPDQKPGPAFNTAAFCAYQDGADYFYRLNDDTEILEPWAWRAIELLAALQPPNVGVVGPYCQDCANHVLVHDIVHRTHVDIFNFYYPSELTDWWLDDWITEIYSPDRMVRADFKVKHHQTNTRYRVTSENKAKLAPLVAAGRLEIDGYVRALAQPKHTAFGLLSHHHHHHHHYHVRYLLADDVPPLSCLSPPLQDDDVGRRNTFASDEEQLVTCNGNCPAHVSRCFLGACACAPGQRGDMCAEREPNHAADCPDSCRADDEQCPPHCFASPDYGIAVMPQSVWLRTRGRRPYDDHPFDHYDAFDGYQRVGPLGHVVELAAGPWTHLRSLLGKRSDLDASVASLTLAEPRAAHFVERFESCAYRTGQLRAIDSDSYHTFPLVVDSGAAMNASLRVGDFDTVISTRAVALVDDAFALLTAVYRSLKPDGQLIWHDVAFDDPVGSSALDHVRPSRLLYDWFLAHFHIVHVNCQHEQGVLSLHVIARKKGF